MFKFKFKEKLKSIKNPYGDGETSKKLVSIIKNFLENNKIDLKKKFYNIKSEVEVNK